MIEKVSVCGEEEGAVVYKARGSNWVRRYVAVPHLPEPNGRLVRQPTRREAGT